VTLSDTFKRFQESEAAGGYLLIACTLAALAVANSPAGPAFLAFWKIEAVGLSLEHWVNDALMAVFFLLIGLELERELYVGELSSVRSALLPAFAAVGGMAAPALLHFALNAGTPTQAGFGIPMATDIAFALAALALLGERVPAALKVFVVAFAVMDDLGAIVVIAVGYSSGLAPGYLAGAAAVWGALVALNRARRPFPLALYLAGGALMWFLMLRSGVHATLAGVLLAFAVPFGTRGAEAQSLSHCLEHALHKPVAFAILPLFALANAGIVLEGDALSALLEANALGIAAGLLVGKPTGVLAGCAVATALGVGRLPEGVSWRHVVGAGFLGGIGFTMSIFIANLAFAGDPARVDGSKLAVLIASVAAGVLGYAWLRMTPSPRGGGTNL
jgi:NhaA family Na+:H+ antiporter